ncbi:MAG: hypothetical protein ACPLRA_04485, partial [Candidatus Saccharicenans sp.]
MIIFLLVVLFIYISINGYIFWRGIQAFSGLKLARLIFILLFLISVLAFPLGRIINGQFRHHFSERLVAVGAYHLALMLYLLLLIFFKDLIRWAVKLFHLPLAESSLVSLKNPLSFLIIIGFSLLIIILGHLNAVNPRLKVLEMKINKTAPFGSELRAVLISDIHLGIINRSNRLEKIVDKPIIGDGIFAHEVDQQL